MADALASIVNEQVKSIITEEFKLIVGLDDELENISITLTAIQKELKDAEERQVRDGSVKVWLEKLRDVSYSIDDVLDEWSTRTLMLQNEVVDSNALVGKVCTSSFNCFCLDEDVLHKVVFFISRFGFDQLFLRHNIAHRIKGIRKRLDLIASEKNKYNFNIRESTIEPERPITSSIVNIPEVFGRKEDKEVIISKLLSESSHQNKGHPIISIVGMGGLGKTTLAQLVFNDDRVKTHFGEKKRWWVCVSDPFDEMRVAKAIIEATGELVPNVQTWEALHQCLCKSVEGKLFLLVLDDMWTEKYQKWEPFMVSLNYGAQGSRIVVTTRNKDVANMMGSTYIHDLNVLSDDDLWSLLGGIALFDQRSEEKRTELEGIGKKIAAKCKGLPLAAKTLGGLLRLKRTRREWENILESETWISQGVKEGVMPALWLSYYDLSSHLKCCFEYFAIFPKDSEILRKELIGLWMAQGFLTSRGEEEMERVGGEYFDDLVTRSLLHAVRIDENGIAWNCNMHDMVHDLVQFITKKESLIIDQDTGHKVAEFGCSANKIRHLTLLCNSKDDDIVDVPSICQAVNLRTLKCFNKGYYGYHIPPSISISLCKLTCLRSLDLQSSTIQELPGEMEKLIHLRYLNLSHTSLLELPESMSKLYNLQTLKLNACDNLAKLHPGIVNLRKVRCLDFNDTPQLEFMPKGMGRLTSLRTLTQFMVSDNPDGCKICELQNLNHLRGSLRITGLENVTCRDEAREAELSKKHQLQELDFHWSGTVAADEEKERCEGVLDGLRPPSNLESLKMSDYPGTKFPKNWMSGDDGMALCPNLRRLEISNCEKCLRLSLPKLPSLEVLFINGLEDVRYMGRNFFGIKDDDVEEMHSTDDDENDDDINIMSNLRELYLFRNSKLKVLPRHLSYTQLRELHVEHCPSLSWGSSCLLLPLLEELSLSINVGDLSKTLAPKYISLPSLKSLVTYESLPEGLCHLTTLRVLTISRCDYMNNLCEELQRLNMLQELHLNFYSSEVREKEAAEYLGRKEIQIPHITVNYKRVK